jgi:hypothetical protein
MKRNIALLLVVLDNLYYHNKHIKDKVLLKIK